MLPEGPGREPDPLLSYAILVLGAIAFLSLAILVSWLV